MTENRSPILQGFDRVIARVRSMHEVQFGKSAGATVWLAEELGTTRQAIDFWGIRGKGVPSRYVTEIARFTGLKPDDIRPDVITVEYHPKTWAALRKRPTRELVDEGFVRPRRK